MFNMCARITAGVVKRISPNLLQTELSPNPLAYNVRLRALMMGLHTCSVSCRSLFLSSLGMEQIALKLAQAIKIWPFLWRHSVVIFLGHEYSGWGVRAEATPGHEYSEGVYMLKWS